MAHAWLIDWAGDPGEVGTSGPRGAPSELLHRLCEGLWFKLYDDDGVMLYEGRLLVDRDGVDANGLTEDEAFAPLDEWGAPNAGATRIDYKMPAGGWETF